MTTGRAVVIGSVMTILVVVGAAVGWRLLADGSSRDSPPFWEGPVWDGTQFVVNDPSTVDQPRHWTSPDGIEWTSQPGIVVGAGDFRCHPDFACNLEPEQTVEVTMLYASPQTSIVAGIDDTALATVAVHYDVVEDLPSRPEQSASMPVQIHPAILAMAARESTCFDGLRRAGPGYNPGPDEPQLVGYGSDSAGDDWRFSATCQLGDETDTFRLDLGTLLDPDEIDLLQLGGEPELWVVRTDGTRERVANPPLVTYLDDRGDGAVQAIAPIVAGDDRFWAVADTGLVTSADGLVWQPFPVDAGDRSIVGVTVSLAGDVALLLSDGSDLDDRGTKLVMVSHDNGRTWSGIIPVGTDGQLVRTSSVGPAGVALSIDEPGGEREVFLDDRTGEMVFSARSPIGNDALIVGAETVLMPRERLGADGEVLGPVLDVYDTTGELITTVFFD